MQSYSHPGFQVSGYRITTTNKDLKSRKDIGGAWAKFRGENLDKLIQGKTSDTLYCVYYNYTNTGEIDQKSYDSLIGFETKVDAIQTSKMITTITIPEQNYKYVLAKGELPAALVQQWKKINDMDSNELNRVFGFDMDMYLEDGVCTTVSVE